MQLHSLRLLCEAHRDAPHQQYCCPASDAWFLGVHGAESSSRTDGPTDTQLMEAEAALQAMLAAPTTADDAAATAVCSAALQRVLRRVNVSGNANLAEFPGPMCSPLCKKDAPALHQQPYTFTEKSDGIRVVVAALWVPDFPSWEICCSSGRDETATAVANASHLVSVFALEKARRALWKSPSPPERAEEEVSLEGQRFSLRRLAGVTEGQEEQGEQYSLTAIATADSPALSSVAVRRRRGRHCVYAVDRSLDCAYLFMDGHTNTAYHDFVLDGELMSVRQPHDPASAPHEHLLLGAFDLFAFTPAGMPEVRLTNATMMERYAHLQAVLSSITARAPSGHRCHAGHVNWYAKTMWRVADMEACLSRLHYSSKHRCFLFDGPFGFTENDGLIFTPDEFPISVGSSSVQLKWKWRHLLSIDWLLRASDKQPDVYTVSLFFMKKNYGHRDDVVGHWRLRKPLTIRNPRGFDMPVDAAVVAECAYDFAHRQWYIQRLRPDKRGANSIVTAISVYESLVENISLPTLLHLLHFSQEEQHGSAMQLATTLEEAALRDVGASSSDTAAETSPPSFDVAEAEKCVTARLTLRAIRESRGNTELYLNAFTNQTNKAVKYPLPFPLRKIRDCVGLGYDPVTAVTSVPTLEEALYIQLGNAGGCYAWSDFVVDAFYNGETGYWELIHLNPRGDNKEAIFDNVLEHLDWLLRCTGAEPEIEAVLRRKRDKPLVVAAAPSAEATRQTNKHYGTVAKELAQGDRSDLRRFNNWVKSVLISSVAAAVRRGLKNPAKLHAVDLCCGRGGDLLKWQHLHPAFVFMTDASVACVAEAAARYSTSEGQSLKSSNIKKKGFPAYFGVHDAFDGVSGLRGDLLKRGPFQLTSCQFSMHYGCRSEPSIRCFVKAVADSLVPGGRFVGTTVNDAELMARAKASGATYGNAVYQVHFTEDAFAQVQAVDFDATRLSYGVAYSTTVERSVQDMVEYVVPWNSFVALCEANHLKLILQDDFLHFFEQQKDSEEGKALLTELQRKRDRSGETASSAPPLSSEELEAVQLYRLFVFEKVAKGA